MSDSAGPAVGPRRVGDARERQARGQTRDPRNDPIGGTEGSQTRGARNDPMGGVQGQTQDLRNDPIRGKAAWARVAGTAPDTRVGVLAERRAGETTEWASGSPGLREALAREVQKRRLPAEVGRRGNDPIRGNAARLVQGWGAGCAGGDGAGPDAGLGAWQHESCAGLGAWRGRGPRPAVVAGWPGVAGAPFGIAAMASGGGAQRPYTRLGRLGSDGKWEPVGW